MKIRSCRKQGPRPNLPRRPGEPVAGRTIGMRLKKVGANVLALVLFVAGGWAGTQVYHLLGSRFTDLVTIREIRTTGLAHVSRKEVIERLDLDDSDTLFTVSPAMLQDKLVGHPWIKEVQISREPFNTIVVDVRERRPAAVLRTGDDMLLLDSEGHIVASLSGEKNGVLPVLEGLEAGRLRQADREARRAVQRGIQVANLIGPGTGGPVKVDLSDPANAVGYFQGVRFEFGNSAFEEKWTRYHMIEASVRPRLIDGRGEMVGDVDLRYPGKVIVRERG